MKGSIKIMKMTILLPLLCYIINIMIIAIITIMMVINNDGDNNNPYGVKKQ